MCKVSEIWFPLGIHELQQPKDKGEKLIFNNFDYFEFPVHPKYFAHDLFFGCGFYLSFLPIYTKVTSLALGQSFGCPGANEVTLKTLKNMDIWLTWIHLELIIQPQQNKTWMMRCFLLWYVFSKIEL